MYDLHCHILPGIDDGPAGWSAALDLARVLVAEGVTFVAAPPHGPGSNQSRHYAPSLLRELISQLREHLQRARIGLQVCLGTEIAFDVGIAELLRAGDVLPYTSTRTVLLEPPTHVVIEHLERAIFDIQLAGYRVVLAHPERTRLFQENPNLLIPLIERGVLMQITAASLVGLHGEGLKQLTTQLLCSGMAQIIASDSHAALGVRAPAMQAAHAYASSLIGEPAAHDLVHTIPELLMNDRPLPTFSPQPVQLTTKARQRWWGKK